MRKEITLHTLWIILAWMIALTAYLWYCMLQTIIGNQMTIIEKQDVAIEGIRDINASLNEPTREVSDEQYNQILEIIK